MAAHSARVEKWEKVAQRNNQLSSVQPEQRLAITRPHLVRVIVSLVMTSFMRAKLEIQTHTSISDGSPPLVLQRLAQRADALAVDVAVGLANSRRAAVLDPRSGALGQQQELNIVHEAKRGALVLTDSASARQSEGT